MPRALPAIDNRSRLLPASTATVPGLDWKVLDLSGATVTDPNLMQDTGTALGKTSTVALKAVHGMFDSGFDGWCALVPISIPSTARYLYLRLTADAPSNSTGAYINLWAWVDAAATPAAATGLGAGIGVSSADVLAARDRDGGGGASSGSVIVSGNAPKSIVATAIRGVAAGRIDNLALAIEDAVNGPSGLDLRHSSNRPNGAITNFYVGLAAEITSTTPAAGATWGNVKLEWATT